MTSSVQILMLLLRSFSSTFFRFLCFHSPKSPASGANLVQVLLTGVGTNHKSLRMVQQVPAPNLVMLAGQCHTEQFAEWHDEVAMGAETCATPTHPHCGAA
jgi:hypothetical protein